MKVASVGELMDVFDAGGKEPFHVEAPLEVWLEVLSKHPELREIVASNKTIPEEVIRRLAKDENRHVRSWIATKRKTPADVLLALARDSDSSVRLRVACNPKVTREVLAALNDDEWEEVRDSVQKRLKKMGEGDENEE